MGHLRPDSVVSVVVIIMTAVRASPAFPVSRVLAYAVNMRHLIYSSKRAQALCLPPTSPRQPRWTGSVKVTATLPTRLAGSGQVDVLCLRKVETSTTPIGYLEDPPVYPEFALRSPTSILTPRIPAFPAASHPLHSSLPHPCLLRPTSLPPADSWPFSSPFAPPCGISGGQKGDDSACGKNTPSPSRGHPHIRPG